MQTYIVLLRGINVSGQKIIKMDALKNMFQKLDLKNVQTYIQSGNIIFQTKKTEIPDMERIIAEKIKETFGFNVPVKAIELDELKEVLGNNPFVNKRNEDIVRLYVCFLSHIPEQVHLEKIPAAQFAPDEFIISGKTIYLFYPVTGYGNSKLTNNLFESKFKVSATTRNWKTVTELVKIA